MRVGLLASPHKLYLPHFIAVAILDLCRAEVAKYSQVGTSAQLATQRLGKLYATAQRHYIYILRLTAQHDVAHIPTYHKAGALHFIGYFAYESEYGMCQMLAHGYMGLLFLYYLVERHYILGEVGEVFAAFGCDEVGILDTHSTCTGYNKLRL